jgi:hypothetical protein
MKSYRIVAALVDGRKVSRIVLVGTKDESSYDEEEEVRCRSYNREVAAPK